MVVDISRSDIRWVRATAIFIVLIGLMNLVSAWCNFDLDGIQFLQQVLDYNVLFGSRFFVSLIGLCCFLIAPGLYRRKRLAWYVSVLLLGLSGIAHILKGSGILEATICMLLTAGLLPLYSRCSVKSDPLQIRVGIGLFFISLLGMALYTLLGLTTFHTKLGVSSESLPFLNALLQVLTFDVSMLHPVGKKATFFVNSILWINGSLWLSAITSLLAPVVVRGFRSEDRKYSQQLAAAFANQPVQVIATSSQYYQWLHRPFRDGFVAYNLIGRLAMALGNPCGSASTQLLWQQWLSYVVEHDWIPAMYQADEQMMMIAREYGFDSLPIGAEALVPLETFTLQGKEMQNLRTASNKAKKLGWLIRPYQPNDWAAIHDINQHWLSIHGTQEEIAYGMGTASPEYLESTRSSVLLDSTGRLLGYVNTLELSGIHSRGVDLMRRDPDAPRGVMEALILYEIMQAKADNCQYYDLGLSALAQMTEFPTDNKQLTKLLNRFYENQKSQYDFQGLHQFKAKFNPVWQPRFLLYKSIRHLPIILLALIELNQGKHFWRKWLRSYLKKR